MPLVMMPLLVACAILLAACAILLFVQPLQANELAVGNTARVLDYLDVPITKTETLNYMGRQQIMSIRSAAVMRYPLLLSEAYQPSEEIFGQIVDGKPWWGMRGSFVYGTGARSIEGESEESRFILNPFLLVGLSSWSSEIWDTSKLSDADMSRSDFPYCWKPSIVRVHPRRQIVQIMYDVTSFDNSLKTFEDRLKDKEPIREFGLVAYNARDFGYNFIHVPVEASLNISNEAGSSEATEIIQFLHSGGSCGCAGGCNNMSPAQPTIDHFKVQNLPATVKVLLWKQKPGSTQDPADMTVMIELR